MKMIQCSIGKIGLIEEDILYTEIEDDKLMDLKQLTEFYVEAEKLVGSKKKYHLIYYGTFAMQTREACDVYLNEKNHPFIAARAIVISDLGQSILARNTLKRSASNVPMQVFNDIQKGSDWLFEIKDKLNKD